MAYPPHLLTADEDILRDFHAHWRVLLPPIGWTVLLLGGAAILAPRMDATVGSTGLSTITWLVAITASIVLAVRPVIRYLYTQYTLTTERIIVRRGIVSRSGIEIPLESITNVHYNQRLVERMLGYGDVLLESAGTAGQSRLTDIPDPEAFQSQIYTAREARMLALDGGGRLPAARDVADQLTQLSDLHDAGKLTDAEFELQKQRLLRG